MKKILSSALIIAGLLIFTSCGGGPEQTLIGSWHVDASSLDLKLGDGFPAEMKEMVEQGKEEVRTEGAEDLKNLTVEFKEDGKFVISMKGEDEKVEGSWKIENEKLVIEAEVEGKRGSITLTLDEVSDEKVALSLSAEDLLAEIKKQMPEALEELPPYMDIDKMAKGTKFMAALKK